MITKEQIIKTLYECRKQTDTTNGVHLQFIFAEQADAILNLLQSAVSSRREQLAISALRRIEKNADSSSYSAEVARNTLKEIANCY